MLIAAAMKRAYEMFGEMVGSVCGKMTKRKISRAIYDDDLIMDEKNSSAL
jgi:hypothetical protein